MRIKIFFGEKPVFLCNELDEELQTLLHHPDAILIEEIHAPAIHALLHEIQKDDFHVGVLLYPDFEELKKNFFKHFTLIEAAGGIVHNEHQELMMIFRLGKWDLPKGKLEEGEKLEDCAIREVEEETGLRCLSLQGKAGETYHTYEAFGKHYLKISHWYYMRCSGPQQLVPQTEEDITQIAWINAPRLQEVILNTYPSIRDLLTM